MDFPYSGLDECVRITKNALKITKNLFYKYINNKTHELYSFGSVARREMGPYSDLDLLIISKKPNLNQIKKYRLALAKALPNHRLDLLEKYKPKELIRIGSIDGTDRQALLFLRNESCNKKNSKLLQEATSQIRLDEMGNFREIFHIMANIDNIYPSLFGLNNIKFSPGGIKDFYFAYLITRFMDEKNEVYNISSAIKYLKKYNLIDNKKSIDLLKILNKLLFLRNRIQEFHKSEVNIINNKTKNYLSKTLCIEKKEFNELIKSYQLDIKMFYLELKKIVLSMVKSRLDAQIYYLVEELLSNKRNLNSKIINEIFNCKYEIPMMLLAYYTTNIKTLKKLRKINPNNWYILYGIANNKYVNEKILFSLMIPRENEKRIVKNLYNNFSWRNIYLYIAKNPSATNRKNNI